jgi:hypothetical protein
MKEAQGYVTDDGTFFESKLEASLYEAELDLRHKLGSMTAEVEAFLAVVITLMPELRRYIDAHNAASTAKLDQQTEDEDRAETVNRSSTEIDAGAGHVSSTEEDLASLLQLPTRGPSNVSNVGSRPRAKEVSKRRAKHGA